MKAIKEILKVGIVDWCWFVLWLKRDEFSSKLCLSNYYPDLDRLASDRNRAHDIDNLLTTNS